MKNMQFCQLSKIDLPIVKDLGILVLVLVTRSRSLHVLPLANSGLGQSSIQVFHREPQTLKKNLPLVGIEPRTLITSDSKYNT